MFKNKKNKIISLLICFLFIVSLISIKASNVKADDVVKTEPSFELRYTVGEPAGIDNTIRVKGIVNNDITIRGEVKALPFEIDYPLKELVLVLDVSESMHESVKGSSDNCKIDKNGICTTKGHNNAKNHPSQYQFSKIYKLREAAKAFVEKFKTTNNLKIAVISYNSKAEILSKGFIESSKTADLIESIDKLSAGQGTNTGEGLRKALYLLNKDNTKANKSIVLMSDGLPTYSTVITKDLIVGEDKNQIPNYFKDITVENGGVIWNTGSGLSDVYGYDLNYAKEIAKINKTNNYNAYSIGYGLNDSGNRNLKAIHKEMIQLPSENPNIEIDENLGYYEANDKVVDNKPNNNYAIESVFQKIAKDLEEKYILIDTNLELESINKDFTLNIAGNKVTLEDLIYTKDDNNSNPNKILYNGNKVSFTYNINGKEAKLNQKLYESISINYRWKDESRKADLKKYLVVDLFTEAERLEHGLYNGFINGKPSIDEHGENNSFNVTPGATYTFGSTFILNVNNIDIKLDVDKNIEVNDEEMKIYKIVNNKLVELTTSEITKDESIVNRYNIKLNGLSDGITNKAEILIAYRGLVNTEVPNKTVLSNNIIISNSSKAVYMGTLSDDEPRLPDLF